MSKSFWINRFKIALKRRQRLFSETSTENDFYKLKLRQIEKPLAVASSFCSSGINMPRVRENDTDNFEKCAMSGFYLVVSKDGLEVFRRVGTSRRIAITARDRTGSASADLAIPFGFSYN